MNSKFDLPIERQVEYQELFGTSMFYVFVLTFFICAILHTSFTYKEHMLVVELSKCHKILLKINNVYGIFNDEYVRYMDTNRMLSIADNLHVISSDSESESNESDKPNESTDDTSCDEEAEKAALRLMGMSRGKNWEF